MARTVHLALLGPFEARWSDGEPLGLKGRKVQALVAYLAFERDRAHTREQLATLLWGDTGQERARHNLRQAVARVRAAASTLFTGEGDVLRLDGSCRVDVEELRQLTTSEDPDDLKRAVELHQRELLEGLVTGEDAFDDWLHDTRARLREEMCTVCERLATQLVERDRTDEAIDLLRHRVAMDPTAERVHCALMRLLARAGRRSEALRQYQKCVEALERKLGVEPSAETREAHEAIRGSSSSPATDESEAPAATASPDGEPPSVAVLPFENLAGESHAYFANGMAEDVITALSRFGSLLVIARESSFKYRGRDLGAQEIGEDLGAQFIIRGSVREARGRIRLNIQLLDASTGRHIWAQRFDRELEDVFAVQDEISETIVSTLAGRVEAARVARTRRLPPERLNAYDLVLRGKDLHHRGTPEDCEKSIEMFERAIAVDGEYALAHAWLGCGLGQAITFHPDEAPGLMARAKAAAERGRELDEGESECHRILAQVSLRHGDVARARSHQERALLLNPNDDRSVCAMGAILTLEGQPGEAESWVRRAMRLNPYHPESVWFHLARALFHGGRNEDAVAALEKVTQPRVRELAYGVAAHFGLEDPEGLRRAVEALRTAAPDFEAETFVRSVPFAREKDRDALLTPLRSAGF
jgi:TolB-like protein/Tfp pilus assembly protein PilF